MRAPLSRAKRHRVGRRVLTLSIVLLGAVVAAGPLSATDYHITVTGDSVLTNSNCTLREALLAVDSGMAVDACPAGSATNRIFLPAANYVFDGGSVGLSGVDLEIIGQGALPENTVVNLFGANDRFLRLQGGRLVLRNLRVLFGKVTTALNGQGGCLAVTGNVELLLDATEFVLCSSASSGGAVFFTSTGGSLGRLEIVRSSFLGNDAAGLGGGGLLATLEGDGTVRIVDSEFGGNEAAQGTGSVSGGGLLLQLGDTASAVVRRTSFVDNRLTGVTSGSSRAGGLTASVYGTAKILVEDSSFEGNGISSVNGVGGVVDTYLRAQSSGTIHFRRNRVLDGFDSDTLGGSLVYASTTDDSHVVVSDSVIAHAVGVGLGIAAVDTGRVDVANVTVVATGDSGISHNRSATAAIEIANAVVWDHGGPAIRQFGDPVTLLANLTGTDPLFVDEVGGDYRLQLVSPARNAGSATASALGEHDVDHGPRTVGPSPDQGAHEFGGLFADGFESGGLGAWSAASP